MIEKAASLFQIDEEVEVARSRRVPPGNRAEHPDVVRTVPCGDAEDLLSLGREQFTDSRDYSPPPACTRACNVAERRTVYAFITREACGLQA